MTSVRRRNTQNNTINRMTKPLGLAALLVGALHVSGCVGGTTYGTDKSHELQTLEEVSNIFSLGGKKQKRIDYRARPDLVIPDDKTTLPAPLEKNAIANSPNWPESPEAKRARLRAKADANTDQIYQAVTDDDGTALIGIEQNNKGSRYYRCLDKVCPEETNKEKQARIRQRVLAAREKTKYSKSGQQRKYLTEPPSVYRTHTGATTADDLGLSEEEMKRRKEAEELAARELKGRGVAPQ